MADPQPSTPPAEHECDAPPVIDAGPPDAAWMRGHYPGSSHSPADREAAAQVLGTVPQVRAAALENQAFLHRAMAYLAGEAGLRQFLDVGAGPPTQEDTHEVAQVAAPGTRVAYVRDDPVVLGHSRVLLAGTPGKAAVRGDLRDPAGIITHPGLAGMIDWAEPVGVLLVAALHFITEEEDPAAIVARFRAAMAAGSAIVISHLHHPAGDEALRQVLSASRMANAPVLARSAQQIDRPRPAAASARHLLNPQLTGNQLTPHCSSPEARRNERGTHGR